MHTELEEWLDEIWKHREPLLRKAKNSQGYDIDKLSNYIYGTYANSQLKSKHARPEDIVCFLGELSNLENTLNSAPVLQHKTWTRLKMGDMSESYLKFGAAVQAQMNGSAFDQHDFDTGMKIAKAFIHYRHGQGNEACTERVYMNVKRPYRIFVFAWVLGPLYRSPANLNGLVSAKLTGPIGDDRPDTIVVYTKDKASSQKVIDNIQAFQNQGYIYCFGGETPRVTRKVKDLQGVSTGTEPPHEATHLTESGGVIARHVGGQSFGSSRAWMIAQALVYVTEHPAGLFKRDKTKFKEAVVKLFREAGIDPENPADQDYIPRPLMHGPLRPSGLF